MFVRLPQFKLRRLGCFAVMALLALGVAPSSGQNLVPNGSFETGSTNPTPWLFSGPGAWENFGHSGTRCASVLGQRVSTFSWYAPLTIETSKPYWVRFWSCATNSLGGYCFGGISTASHDFARPSEQWTEYAYATWVPDAGAPQFRLSSWDGTGPVYFDDAEVLPLNAVHTSVGDYQLGLGESLKAGVYQFNAQYTSFAGNVSRPMYQGNAPYNTTYWYFNSDSYVTYRHELAGQPLSNARVACEIRNNNNIVGTTVIVDASTDGVNWQPAGAMSQTTAATFSLPASLQPASVLYVRLRSTNAMQFYLSGYSFTANVPDETTDAKGDTICLGKLFPGEDVRIIGIADTSTGRVATLSIPNPTLNPKPFTCTARTTSGTITRERSVPVNVPAGATNLMSLLVPTAGLGNNTTVFTVCDDAAATNVFQQISQFTINILNDDSFGELLPSPTNCPAWTCSGDFKVGSTRGVPVVTNTTVQISAARNEYEPFQLVLQPPNALSNVWASISDFISVTNSGVGFSSTNVTVNKVEYVPLTVPDPAIIFSVPGDYPDALMPLTAPFNASGGTNSPLWFTVYVPKNVPAGDYVATVTVQFEGGSFAVPVRLHIFGFALTDVSHTRTAYGVQPQENWHGFNWATFQQRTQVWELYMQNMARHRASPVFPQYYTPIQYTYNVQSDSFTYDFAGFDAVMDRFIEEYGFNSFRDLNDLAALPYIEGVEPYNTGRTAITPEYRRLYLKLMPPILQHLRERGWLGLAYSQWIDEPQANQIPMVQQGMAMVEETGPDHQRMYSGFNGPVPDLFGSIDIWQPHWDFDMYFQYIEPRHAAGEEVWYYVCTSPKDPWPNNLIDQPGVCPRIRQWYAERFQLDGEGYWGINYYLGMTNPWTQTLSVGGTAQTFLFNLGNGDGNLVYPPVKEKPTNTVVVAGPVNSTRFETTRDGYEDREYFWLLKRALAVAAPQLGANHPAVIEGNAALTNVSTLLSWPPIYPYEPHRLADVRLRVAAAIEGLDTGAPFVAKNPLSKVVTNGAAQTLRVEAVGWPLPSVQWQHAGTNLPGATAAKLILTNITSSMAGDYRVLLSNSVGTAVSSVGKLTVLEVSSPPQIITQPTSLSRTNQGRAVFGVGASSLTPLTYQWYRGAVAIVGATNVTLVLSNLTEVYSGSYSVVVSNVAGTTTSASASLSVQPPELPFVITPPTGASIISGQNASFSVSAGGTPPLGFQWQFNGTNLPTGGNGSSVSFTNVQLSQAGGYRVVVTNVAGAVTSAVATLVVQVIPPTLTSQPTNQLVAPGGSVSFSATATGSAPLTYRWFFNTSNLIAGAVTNVLAVTNVQSAQLGSYRVVVTNASGAATSALASLQFYTMPNYTNEPPGIFANRGNGNLMLTLAPDNRNRTVFVSTNLQDWSFFYFATPSDIPVLIPTDTTNGPRRFFRMQVTP